MDVPGTAGRSLGVKEPRWFGMTARRGTVLAGAFSILSTHMYLIFEHKHLGRGNCTAAGPAGGSASDVFGRLVVCWSLVIALLLALGTVAAGGWLLYAVHAQVYWGLLLYVAWIAVYEAASLGLLVLTAGAGPGPVRALRWFGLASRALAHCCGLSCVVAYARVSHKSQSASDILSHGRRGSLRGLQDSAARRPPRHQL